MRIFPILVAASLTGALEAMEAGFQTETFKDADRDRPVLIDWWYPVANQKTYAYDYGLGRGRVVVSGTVALGKFPLVVLSHGAMGAARNYSWIAESLARSGIIVAGISHFGESYMYGDETVDPTSVLDSWERPLDISAALTYIENKSALSSSVDLTKAGFIGHSSGGATAMYLAGVLFDQQLITEYCASSQSTGDRGCDYARSTPAGEIGKNLEEGVKSYVDPRLKTFIVLDPALGPGFFDYTGVDPKLKILIVGSVQNDFLPFQHHAEKYAKNLPNAKHHWLNKGEGHFIYLNECESELKANGVPLCIDRSGVSRSDVHEELKSVIYRFLQQNLSASS